MPLFALGCDMAQEYLVLVHLKEGNVINYQNNYRTYSEFYTLHQTTLIARYNGMGHVKKHDK
jgi:hypothetical protein